MPTPLTKTLLSRWTPALDSHGVGKAVGKHFNNALDIVDRIEARRLEIAADKNLSDYGRAEKMREIAAGEAGHVSKAMRAVDAAKDAVRKTRLGLTPTVKDKSDLASAMLRQEARALLRSKDTTDVLHIAMDPNADSLVIEAIFEAPTALSNISQVHRDQLLAMVVERTAGPQVAALKEQDDAIELLEVAIRASKDALREVTGIAPNQFEKWLTENAPIDPKTIEAESAAFKTEAVSADALGLSKAARSNLIDQLLATNAAEVTAA